MGLMICQDFMILRGDRIYEKLTKLLRSLDTLTNIFSKDNTHATHF